MPLSVDFNKLGPFFERPKLLCHPQIPYPLSGVAPRTVVQDPEWWDRERHKAYEKNGQYCWACGGEGPLEAHEVFHVDYVRGKMYYQATCALCKRCHSFIHAGFLVLRLFRGVVTYAEFKNTILHGHGILVASNLKANWGLRYALEDAKNYKQSHVWMKKVFANLGPKPKMQNVPWPKWRMVFQGREYPPKYSSAKVANISLKLEVQT